ncbi:MAG: CCA tRNA nucleotidyltransferase [Nanoarchaeota archaeon]
MALTTAKAKEFISPSKEEEKKIYNIVSEVLQDVSKSLKKHNIRAKILIGGSVGKHTWLSGTSDIDFFIAFNYISYKDKSAELADYAEKVLLKYKPTRLKGSRDYFSAKYKGFDLEFVPVLEINDIGKALNITDASPLHVYYVADKIAENKNLAAEIRLAKQFFKSADAYGAESYISGFSGYVIEILILHYKSFDKLIKAASKWKHRGIIDIEKHHKNAVKSLNTAKLDSPLIVVDPIDYYRNAAAALRNRRFANIITHSKSYLKKPSLRFFEVKHFSPSKLKRENTIILSTKPIKKTRAVAGDVIVSKFNKIRRAFLEHDFDLNSADWYWNGNVNENAYYVFRFSEINLPKKRRIVGPPKRVHKKYIAAFTRKWRGAKLINDRYFAETKRKYTNVNKFLKVILKDKTIRKV